MKDWTFQKAFSRIFVYNILFEDAEQDGRFLGLDEDSRVLSISAAGCGVASMMRFSPTSIDAVDINRHHLALAALKVAGTRSLGTYGEFYDLFGRGWLPRPERSVRRCSEHLPRWMQRYWRVHHQRFASSLYNKGLTARMLHTLRQLAGVDADWLRASFSLSPEERARLARNTFGPLLRKRVVERAVNSPAQLLALGVNFEQKDKMLEDTDGSMVEFLIRHLERVASSDVQTNWFAWYGIAGHFDHGNDDAVPPYLRREAWEKSMQAHTRTEFHHRSIFDVLGNAGEKTWSHYTFCDAVDWMPAPVQKKLMDEVIRTARPGAVVLWRSVEEDDLVERHGYGDRFVRMARQSDLATREDRSKQYKRVDFYQVQA